MASDVMTPKVRTIQDKGDKAALLILDDGSKPVWTPDRELARTLLGKPIPSDWTIKDGEYGPQALPPRPKGAGGMVAWRNSKEGFEAEAAGRRRWQEIEEERRDRRTALMQSVEHLALVASPPEDVIRVAEQFYDWLRESSPAAGPAAQPAGVATTEERPRTPPQAGASTSGGTPPADAGKRGVGAHAPPEGSSADGEAAAKEPGEGSVKTSPGSTIDCTHRAASGRWLPTSQVEGIPVCPRCGANAILYRES